MSEHTAGAIRAAAVICDGAGHPTSDAVAGVIDSATGLPELIAALEATKEFLDIPCRPEVWEALNEIVSAALAKTQQPKEI